MKKTLLISLILSISAWADGQLCYQPDASQPDQQICIPVSADVQTAISNYVAAPGNQVSTTNPDGTTSQTPKYAGIGDAIFQNINLFFQGAIANFPPDSVQQVIDAQTAQVAAVKAAVLNAAHVPASQADPAVLVKPVPLPIKKQVQ
jgi:hypothetical protein